MHKLSHSLSLYPFIIVAWAPRLIQKDTMDTALDQSSTNIFRKRSKRGMKNRDEYENLDFKKSSRSMQIDDSNLQSDHR